MSLSRQRRKSAFGDGSQRAKHSPRTSLNRTSGLVDDVALEWSGVVGEVDGNGSIDALGNVAGVRRVDLSHGSSAEDHLAGKGLKVDADGRRELELGADGEGRLAVRAGDGERLVRDEAEVRSLKIKAQSQQSSRWARRRSCQVYSPGNLGGSLPPRRGSAEARGECRTVAKQRWRR